MLYHKNQNVTVRTPARLHLGFVDLGGALGRKFISAGVTIGGFYSELSVRSTTKFESTGPGQERALEYARILLEKWKLAGGGNIRIKKLIPRHAG